MDIHNYPPIDYEPLLKYGERIAVHCKTEEEAKHLIARMVCDHPKQCGSSWSNENINYHRYGTNTCYRPSINTTSRMMSYCSLEYYIKNGFTIIPFEELLILPEIEESEYSICSLIGL